MKNKVVTCVLTLLCLFAGVASPSSHSNVVQVFNLTDIEEDSSHVIWFNRPAVSPDKIAISVSIDKATHHILISGDNTDDYMWTSTYTQDTDSGLKVGELGDTTQGYFISLDALNLVLIWGAKQEPRNYMYVDASEDPQQSVGATFDESGDRNILDSWTASKFPGPGTLPINIRFFADNYVSGEWDGIPPGGYVYTYLLNATITLTYVY